MFTQVAAPEAAVGEPRKAHRRPPLAPYLYLLPAVALIGLWIYRPMVEGFGLSFYDWNLLPTSPKEWVGLENYADVVTNPEMIAAMRNTLVYIAAGFVAAVILPTIAVLLSRKVGTRSKSVYQGLIFVSFLIPPIAAGAVWRWMFAEDSGLLWTAANNAGLDLGNIFRDPSTAIWAIIAIMVWQMLGFGVLVVAAGVAGINPDYADAAATDGAGSWRTTMRITVPLLSPTLLFLGLMAILLSAQWSFPLIDLLTQGGPINSTTNIYYLLYQLGFQSFDAGLAAAAGVVFFLLFGLVAVGFVLLSEKLNFHDN
ncbi:carbohydrate ABC transporter permease [Demequina flava]|uniref:carbohydrate ABC transporter permease n=1 Tax=Demequina flava TaxID=1095025 RepID=UPI000781622B|nr:sugar ABC transporter permease [Demequina flava]